jgi:predicted dinucleotide-binding enzyme
MKIAVLGTGIVGRTIATKLVELGHHVRMGSRRADHPGANEWAKLAGGKASVGTFAEAAAFGELVWNCTSGGNSLAALEAAGADNLAGKVLVDVANPLDFSKGMPPTLTIVNDDSLGEAIARTFPQAKVVKTLNTMNCQVMVDPGRVPGDHDVFVCGEDAPAKAKVVELLRSFGWKKPIDLGGISAARGTEMWLLLWVRLFGALGTADFNLHLAMAKS